MRVTYIALATLFSVASCTKEATEPDVIDWADGEIYFKTFLSDIASSRAQDMALDRLESFQVTCFNTADIEKDPQGYLSPYFENSTFIRKPNDTFESSPAEGPCNWPAKDAFLRFFAFSPSIASMADGNTALDGKEGSATFNLINSTTETETAYSVGYRLGNIRINPDISKQFDFITAEASGTRMKDFMGGVELTFSHELCQVELKAWGASADYDFDIAGVRIGNPVVEGTFVFADDNTPEKSGKWELPENADKDRIDYQYQNGGSIFRINREEHNTQESAASIMGLGGCAMVIPTKNEKWEAPEDPRKVDSPYTTDKMYFSILMRVTDAESGDVIYPYPGNKSGMTVISYAVNTSGNIVRRLYAGKTEGSYFTDSDLKIRYVADKGEEVLDFGWAAVPVDVDWRAGKKYVYTLNYSEGIGLHDPEDPEPGKLIVGQTPIEWSVNVSNWEYAEKDENYDPDLEVP